MSSASTSAAGSSDPTKKRILGHMTRDHRLSLLDYLSYYKNIDIPVDSAAAATVEMSGIELDHFTVTYTLDGASNPEVARFDFTPPLNSLSDARVALVDRAKEAAHKRGFETTRITKFERPDNLLEIVIFVLEFFQFPFAAKWLVAAGLPSLAFADYFKQLGPYTVLGTLAVVHAAEAIIKMLPKLNRYRVPAPQKYYWLASTFFGGFTALQRFDKLSKAGQH
ncbi:hypothetical protein D0Z00_001222 [Geotrichum galactomycetum]|uniref:Uncharacterized protein n=1 Tax=Geotrichum galactomycetum TaxID=27317 RepID=A0ACB6V7I0_9ASCO|nr:hypothetical protein D0Z00_001222 [Geotrichum candidum]